MGFLQPKPAQSSSGNTNAALIKSKYEGTIDTGNRANSALSRMLGVGGALDATAETGGADPGFQNYLQQAGYAPAMRQLSRGITGQGAASGLLNSGATARALQSRGTELNQGFFNNYANMLQGLSSQGMQAGGLVAQAGQQSSSTGAKPSTIGTIASLAGKVLPLFSDRRLKEDIEKIGEEDDGLGIYSFRYRWGTEKHIGVMADEVATLRPHALGPTVDGYATVDYEAL